MGQREQVLADLRFAQHVAQLAIDERFDHQLLKVRGIFLQPALQRLAFGLRKVVVKIGLHQIDGIHGFVRLLPSCRSMHSRRTLRARESSIRTAPCSICSFSAMAMVFKPSA